MLVFPPKLKQRMERRRLESAARHTLSSPQFPGSMQHAKSAIGGARTTVRGRREMLRKLGLTKQFNNAKI